MNREVWERVEKCVGKCEREKERVQECGVQWERVGKYGVNREVWERVEEWVGEYER